MTEPNNTGVNFNQPEPSAGEVETLARGSLA